MQSLVSRQRRARNAKASPTAHDVAPIVRLWLLRMLVPLDAQRSLVSQHGFGQDSLLLPLGLERWQDKGFESFDPTAFRAELRKRHQEAEAVAAATHVPPRLAQNLARLAQLVGLADTELRILEFAVMLFTERLLDDTADHLGTLSSLKVFHALAGILDLPQAAVRQAFDAYGPLATSGLLTLDRNGSGTLRWKLNMLSDRFADHVTFSDGDPIDLLREAVQLSTPGHLTLADYDHVAAPLGLLRTYLAKAVEQRRTGVNILLHGSPGTGKNQLVKALSATLGCALYEVSSEDSDGDPVSGSRRLRAFRAAQSVLSRTPCMILFDEVQDVFDPPFEHGFREAPAAGHKAWINRTLETSPVPSLWLTNSIRAIDRAFLRRFDMILELPVPARAQRERIARAACDALVDDATIARLADCDALAPAVIARAASVVRFVGPALVDSTPAAALVRLVDQTLQAQGHAGVRAAQSAALPEVYDPGLLNADADLAAVAAGLATAPSARLCLYGPPGTGKTAWARRLARTLGKRLLVRRASDLMSMWVGETEKNMAQAFQAARDEDAVLLIDEVDSFLQDRRGAQRGWEVSQVNEMLTQMETFDGLFVASTNLMDGLDPAALRRFDLKIRFAALRAGQAVALLAAHLGQLGLPAATAALDARIARLDALTPGDFAAVARQHRFRRFDDAAQVVAALEGEVDLKRQGAPRSIGFT